MADLETIRKYISLFQWSVRVPRAKGKDAVMWSANEGFDASIVNFETSSKESSFHSQRPPVSLQWNNITLATNTGKPLLKALTGSANTGELTAIMGPSGAGKSTLLNVLSGFTRAKVTGCITVNGAPRNTWLFQSCYIMQDDHLLAHLTVRESIQLAARLKIPSSVSRQARDKAVKDCMRSLGLSELQNSKANQLSGGQRKRLCIAQELVSNPTLIFLDEPTSGLDSSTCLQCIQLLKSLAEEGRTVICTIHQPSARIFELFDKLYMLAEGHCIYRGLTKNLIPFLSEQGLSCPTYHNPADFVTEVASGDHGNYIWRLKTAIDTLDGINDISMMPNNSFNFNDTFEIELENNFLDDQVITTPNILKENALESDLGGYATSSWNQFKVLTYRSLICTLREPMATQVRFISHVLTGLLIGLLYYNIGNDATKVFSNCGFLFFSLIFLLYTALMPTLLTFPLEKTIFAREYINSWYSTKMYYLAMTVSEIPFQILFPGIYCGIVYWMTAQPNDLVRFAIFTLSCIVFCLVAQSVGYLIGAATSVQNAVFLGPVVAIPFILFSGFFINLELIPSYMQWLPCLSYVRFCFHSLLLSIYGLERSKLQCDKIFCPFQEPQVFLREMAMTDGSLYVDFAAMLASFIVFRVISCFVLYFKVVYNR